VTAVEEVISQVPAAEMGVGPMKLQALIKLDEQEKALEYAAKLAKTDLSKQANGLNAIAWSIVDPDAGIKPGKKLIEFALETARHADELAQSKEAGIADTLAKTYFDAGDAAKAIETQERAVRLTKGSPYEAQIDDFRSRLEKYKKAAK
jgi:tetratricopeptide (TPR) repeat protein